MNTCDFTHLIFNENDKSVFNKCFGKTRCSHADEQYLTHLYHIHKNKLQMDQRSEP